ncbi:MAG: hypothetical protein AAFZ52_14560 [Bacteroidota bacterium]
MVILPLHLAAQLPGFTVTMPGRISAQVPAQVDVSALTDSVVARMPVPNTATVLTVPTIVELTSTTAVELSDLSLEMEANAQYWFFLSYLYQAHQDDDTRVLFQVPAGGTSFISTAHGGNAQNTTLNANGSGTSGSGQRRIIHYLGVITTTDAGTFTISARKRSNATAAAAFVYAGTTVQYLKIAD